MTIEVLPPTDGSASGVSERLMASASSALCLRDVTSTSSICDSGCAAAPDAASDTASDAGSDGAPDCCAIEGACKPIDRTKALQKRPAHTSARRFEARALSLVGHSII